MVEASQTQNFDSIEAEQAKIAAECAQRNFETRADAESVKITMAYSEFKQCQLNLRYPSDYPKEAVQVDFKSTTVPQKLVNLLTKRVETHIETLAKNGNSSALAAFLYLDNILLNNNLIPCWAEFADIKPLIGKNDTLKPLEKAGKLAVTLQEGKFKLVAEFVIPPSYPMQAAKLTFKEHNFNPVIASIFEAQSQAIIRRLWSGMDPGYEGEKQDVNEGKIGFKKQNVGAQADIAKMAVATRSELKHDMDFLKQQAELRNGDMNKQDRKAFKLNIKHEKRYEEEMQKKSEEEMKAKQALGEHGQMNRTSAQPQLYHAINFLVNFFVRFLPKAQCDVCCKPLVTAVKND